MRLTLGTLLAYLDDVLSAQDAETMKHKIEESEFATRLVHRIRNAMRKLRLGSPRVIESGNSDANSVAEYLDSTLPADKAPDFEKMCLESDVHLAEVASCHQIRAILLVQPAEVPPALREHIYRVGNPQQHAANANTPAPTGLPEPAAMAGGVNGAAASSATAADSVIPVEDSVIPVEDSAAAGLDSVIPVETAGNTPANAGNQTGKQADDQADKPTPKPKPEVPEYLRSGKRAPLWPYAAVGVLVFALTGLALLAMGPLNNNHPLASLFGAKPNPAADAGVQPADGQPANGQSTPPVVTTGDGAAAPAPEGAADGVVSPPHAFVSEQGIRQPSPVPGAGAVTGPDAAPAAPLPSGQAPPVPGGQAPPLPSGQAPPLPTGQAPPLPGGQAPPLPTGEAPPLPTGEAPPLPTGEAPPLPAGEAPLPAGTAPAVPGSGVAAPAAPVTKPAPVGKPVGSFVTAKQVLATRNPETGDWQRVALNDSIHSGQQLLVLPTYRPRIALGDLMLTLQDETRATIYAGADGVLRLELLYGRAVLNVVGAASPVIQIEANGIRSRVTLSGDSAAVAVEATLIRRPGVDPVTGVVTSQLDGWCTSGEAAWSAEAGDYALKPGHRVSFRTGLPPASGVSPAPVWATPDTRSSSDTMASERIEPLIATDRPLVQSLMEIFNSENRLQENRSLAMRSLAAVDHFDFFFTTLTERDQRSFWDRNIAAMRRALSRSPASAEQIKSTLQRSPGDTTGDLVLELLVGYSEKQLISGGSKKLVTLLNHESMPVRVLAFNNLFRITGKSFMYFPDREHPQSRIKALRRWQALEEAKQITWAAGAAGDSTTPPPAPLPATEGAPAVPPAAPLAPPASPVAP